MAITEYCFTNVRPFNDRQPVFVDAAQIAKLPVRYSEPAVAALFGAAAASSPPTAGTPPIADEPIDTLYVLIKG